MARLVGLGAKIKQFTYLTSQAMTNTSRLYSPSAEYRYFLYCPNDGHTFYRSREERDTAAKDLINEYLDDGEWSEEVVDIYAGEATHQVIETERLDKAGKLDEDGYDENGEYWGSDDIDYKYNHDLRPLVPGPPAEGEARELAALRQLAKEILTLVSESEDVAGLHHNGDIAPWDELLPGGRFERLTSLDANV